MDNPTPAAPANRHAPTAYETQRAQLDKLLKDPSKPVVLPEPPAQKIIRAPREMMKNVQGSSAGAGSGEFHVYKQNRRREYERIKMMEEQSEKETAIREFEQRRAEREAEAESKTAKNRAKRLKRKERGKGSMSDTLPHMASEATGTAQKRRRLENHGVEVIDQAKGEDNDVSPELCILGSAEQPAAAAEESVLVVLDDP
ncbi:DUF1168-domain-containing protein [Dacryopinax primogenitus]|uniref:DUF1168-domain-containing protein n=1 Tax=Dacryopinax primogenitus (strain DJM 731) TaxID=1858805 RepID=M5G6X8_DACPD|nr:DUF1168-domain-containing protein [Dacryopinax primogenitus]EJU04464.1 DUF1168-domain-containing protein [Dacryopinax primogenitus]